MKLFKAFKNSMPFPKKRKEPSAAEALESDSEASDSQSEGVQHVQSAGEPMKLFNDMESEEDKLVGVIVTIFEQESYDENFREVRPETVPGERVSTYSLSLSAVGQLHGYLLGTKLPTGMWSQLVQDIRSVAADSVTFNWECCGACSDEGFCKRRFQRLGSGSHTPHPTVQFISFALQSGFSVMCSDFSLKALIKEWSPELLGPNPFTRVNCDCDERFQLEFFPEHLKDENVPQQLQVVGELCASDGKAVVSALGDTIVYTVNPRRAETEAYQLKVLTVVTDWTGTKMPAAMECEIQQGDVKKRGAAGHVALSYPSGGQLITSMGHWIELTRINTFEESIMQVAARNFGDLELRKHVIELDGARTEVDRQRCVQKLSKQMIQKSVPSKMKGRTKYWSYFAALSLDSRELHVQWKLMKSDSMGRV